MEEHGMMEVRDEPLLLRAVLAFLGVAGVLAALLVTLIIVALCWEAAQQGVPPAAIATLVAIMGAAAACMWAALYIALWGHRHA
jgi:hypothetical protein